MILNISQGEALGAELEEQKELIEEILAELDEEGVTE
jgi:hypothetical protein